MGKQRFSPMQPAPMPQMTPGQGAMAPNQGALMPQGTGLIPQMQPQKQRKPPLSWQDYMDVGVMVNDGAKDVAMSFEPEKPVPPDEMFDILLFLMHSLDKSRVLWMTVPERIRRHFEEHSGE